MIMTILRELWENEKTRHVLLVLSGLLVGVVATVVMYPTKQIKEEAQKELRIQIEQEVSLIYAVREEALIEGSKKQVSALTSQVEKSIADTSLLQKKVSSLTYENTKLKQKRKTETVVVKRPDGTEETRIVDETDTETSSIKNEQQITELTETHKREVKKLESKYQEELIAEQSKSQKKTDELTEELAKSREAVEQLEKTNKTVTTNMRPFSVGAGYTTDNNYSAEASYQFWGPVYLQISGDSNFESNYLGRATLGIRF